MSTNYLIPPWLDSLYSEFYASEIYYVIMTKGKNFIKVNQRQMLIWFSTHTLQFSFFSNILYKNERIYRHQSLSFHNNKNLNYCLIHLYTEVDLELNFISTKKYINKSLLYIYSVGTNSQPFLAYLFKVFPVGVLTPW